MLPLPEEEVVRFEPITPFTARLLHEDVVFYSPIVFTPQEGREITKLHEEWLRGSLTEILDDLRGRAALKGEFVVVVGPSGCGKSTLLKHLIGLYPPKDGTITVNGALLDGDARISRLILAGIAIPAIVSISEDALDTVPQSYRDASLALGATEWQTIWSVTLPAARSGVLTAIMLGIGRAIGETMVVLMVTGNAPMMPQGLATFINPTRTMTATIAAEMGEVANGSVHYHVLFFIGIVLFLISLVVNITATSVIFRQRKRQERILS